MVDIMLGILDGNIMVYIYIYTVNIWLIYR